MCGETMPFRDLLNHVRLMHPDVYEPDLMAGPVEVTVNYPTGGRIDAKDLTRIVRDALRRQGGCSF